MSYKALLFCPDEKTARTVTQVLSELEFEVQPCNEPFAAVKKLTTEHFDAIVVDCENEQNAVLLFKSARNSGSNQASLSIAVVEGQAGVAKAFRIGANLVLPKPINVEQSKGTIRVARGLLRKSESAKAAASNMEQPTRPSVSSVPSAIADVSASAPSSVFELEAEPETKPEPTEAALLESMPDPAASMAREAAADPSMGSSWQPISKPMATALRDAAGAAGYSEPSGSSDAALRAASGSSVFGAGAAAAPAKHKPAPAEESTHEIEPPSFATSIGKPRRALSAEAGGSRKAILIAAVILAAAAAGYFGWTKTHYRFSLNFLHRTAKQIQVVHQPAPVPATPASTPNPEPTAIATPAPPPSAEVSPPPPAPAHEEISPSNEAPAPKPKKAAAPIASSDEEAPAPKAKAKAVAESSVPAIVVKRGGEKPVEQPVTSEAPPEPNAPGALSVAADSKDEPIAGLVNVSPSVPNAAPQTLKVSQGVSQGLLVKKVAPVYPQQALQMRTQGAVELIATISKDGDIANMKVLSGDAILARAAMEAVKQWKYKPYLLDSQPVEIETQITVNFKLP